MYLTKYKVGDETAYRLSESSSPGNIQLRKDNRVGQGRKISESIMTHFNMIDKVLKEKPVEEEVPAEGAKSANSIANVIRKYAETLKEN